MNKAIQPMARIFLGYIFVLAEVGKLGADAYAGTRAYMESMGAPGLLLTARGAGACSVDEYRGTAVIASSHS